MVLCRYYVNNVVVIQANSENEAHVSYEKETMILWKQIYYLTSQTDSGKNDSPPQHKTPWKRKNNQC